MQNGEISQFPCGIANGRGRTSTGRAKTHLEKFITEKVRGGLPLYHQSAIHYMILLGLHADE
jgi:hypothetical protein